MSSDTIEAIRDVRHHARQLGITVDPMFDVSSQVRKLGVPVAAVDEGQRRSDFRLLHEAVEHTWRPARTDLTEFGREVMAAEGACEILAPAATIGEIVDSAGWDLAALRDALPTLSWELLARRLPVIAHERETLLLLSIVDDGRVYLRRASDNPWQRCRTILPEEVACWQRCVRADPRELVEWRGGLAHQALPLFGSKPYMPDPDQARRVAEPDGWDAPNASIRVWPVPPAPHGRGPRREIMVTVVQV